MSRNSPQARLEAEVPATPVPDRVEQVAGEKIQKELDMLIDFVTWLDRLETDY